MPNNVASKTCGCYNDDGTVCGRTAHTLDRMRQAFVCHKHLPTCVICGTPTTIWAASRRYLCMKHLPQPHDTDFSGAFDGTTVTSDADPGL